MSAFEDCKGTLVRSNISAVECKIPFEPNILLLKEKYIGRGVCCHHKKQPGAQAAAA